MKRPGLEADRLSASNEVKNVWSCLLLFIRSWPAHHSLKEVYFMSFYGVFLCSCFYKPFLNLLGPELFFLILAHPVYKM